MFRLQISDFKFTKKPSDFDIRAQTFGWYKVGLANVPRMAELISEGRCWRNGNYDLNAQSFKKKHVVDAHFIVLDFDEVKETPEQMSEIMSPNFWYYTLSQGIKSNNNFRMVWVLTEAIRPHEFEQAYSWFLEKFPKADRNTKDISRMWYGGNGDYKVLSENLLDITTVDGLELRSQPSHRYESTPHNYRAPEHASEVSET